MFPSLTRPVVRWLLVAVSALVLAVVFISPAFGTHYDGHDGDGTSPGGPPEEKDPSESRGGAYTPDEMLVVLGFTVEIAGAGAGTDPDSAWETATGGSLHIEVADSSTGGDQVHTTTPGHKYVGTLTLRGPLTAGRKAICDWINQTSSRRGSDDGQREAEACPADDARAGAMDHDEILENGAGKFAIDIEGAPIASANVESITVEDLVVDEREVTTGSDWDYRTYAPGDAHYGSITIRSRVGEKSTELYQWWYDSSRGENIRKSISVIAKKRDGSEARRFNFFECFPVRYQPFVLDGSVRHAAEEVTASCERVELWADGPRQALMEWINATLQGEDSRRIVTVKEIMKDGSDGKSFIYQEAFPTRYVFPSFSAPGTGTLYEEVSIKPIRLELD